MKKDIGFVGMDSSTAEWIYEKLHSFKGENEGADELLDGIENLIGGKISALMLELGSSDAIFLPKDTIISGELSIYPKLRKVIRSDEEIILTPKEFDILYFLAQNRGEVFTKEQIYRAVWADDYLLDDSNIMAFIRKLRKKIEPDPDAPKYILTIWGIGYKFNDQP